MATLTDQDRHQKCSRCAHLHAPSWQSQGCSHPRLPAPRCHSSVSRLHAQRLVFMQMRWEAQAMLLQTSTAFWGVP